MYNIPALIERSSKLASLPDVYYRLSNAINNPSSSLKDIADIIAQDPALTAQLLRIANSALFNFPARIDTVSQAITIVGIQQLRELTLACSVMNAFPMIPEQLVSSRDFWQHSIAVGVACRVIADYRKESNIERFYVLGLLHDIGRLLMFLADPEEATKLLASEVGHTTKLLHNIEHDNWGCDHSEIGSLLLTQWKLPRSLSEPIRYHHNPDAAKGHLEEAAVLHFADILAHVLELGGSGEKRVPKLSESSWIRLGLGTDQLGDILEEIERQYQESLTIFASALH